MFEISSYYKEARSKNKWRLQQILNIRTEQSTIVSDTNKEMDQIDQETTKIESLLPSSAELKEIKVC